MTAPERIWADLNGTWYDEATSFRGVPYPGYILATHEALAASPEVAALIAEARREERERAAGIAAVKMTEWARATYQNPDARMQNAAKVYAAGEIITAIRALKEETP